jgi:hypothetical protein
MSSFAYKKHEDNVIFIEKHLKQLDSDLKQYLKKLPNLNSEHLEQLDSDLINALKTLDSKLKQHLKKLSKKVKISITKNKESFDFMINANNEKIFVCSFTNNNGKVNIIPRVLLNTQKNY